MPITLPSKYLRWLAYGVAAVIVLLVILWGLLRYHQGKMSELQQRNAELQREYDEAIGEAKAHERNAAELKLQNEALKQVIAQGNQRVKDLETKREEAVKRYEQEKANLGDCGDNADCLRKLCDELRAAGFPTNCEAASR
jgi:Tfp pilus assembly protein PilN